MSMGKAAPFKCTIGVIVLIIHLTAFLTTMLKSPGIPKAEVTDQDIVNVINKKYKW